MNDLAIEINNPLTHSLNKIKQESVLKEFFDDSLPRIQCPISLHSYLSNRPEKFYCRHSFSEQSIFLNEASNKSKITNFLNSNHSQLDHALKLLAQINKKTWHDLKLPSDEYDFISFCDSDVNPSYLILIEGVLGTLIHANAIFCREDRDKKTDGLDIYNRVEEIKKTKLAFISNVYCNTTRNSIAHGNVRYLHRNIEFKDKNNTVINSHSEYIKRFDALLDVCNGLALAYKVLFFNNLSILKIPKQVLLEELYAKTEAPWWRIEGCLDSEAGDNRSQLVIFINPRTRDYRKVHMSSIWTAILAESYAPGYDRYFLSLRSPLAYHGFAAFDGNALLDRRKNKVINWDGYAGILESDLLFWVPFIKLPEIIYKIHTYIMSIQLYIVTQRLLHIKDHGVEIHARDADIHRNGWRVVLEADVVLESKEEITSSIVKEKGSKLISLSLKTARRKMPMYSIVKYLPLGYARVSVFNKDYRCRVLKNYGLCKELIGTVQVQKIMRIKSPDIFGSTIEHVGKIKYAWNNAWQENNG